MGYAKAAELIFSGEIVKADQALRIGLGNQLVLQDRLTQAAREMAVRIAKNAPIPIAFAMRGLQHFYRWDLEQALDYECDMLEMCRKADSGPPFEARLAEIRGRIGEAADMLKHLVVFDILEVRPILDLGQGV